MGGPIQNIDSGEKLPNLTSINSDYTVEKSDRIIGVDTSAGAITITIPTALIIDNDGTSNIFIIKDETGNAATNNITIATEGSETIDGDTTKVINTNYGSIGIYADGTNLLTL